MKGIYIKQAKIVSEDERRKIVSILNGELGIRDIHLLEMKKGEQILGNHKHWYAELCYVYKGKCHYWLKNKEGEESTQGEVPGGEDCQRREIEQRSKREDQADHRQTQGRRQGRIYCGAEEGPFRSHQESQGRWQEGQRLEGRCRRCRQDL